MRKALLSLCFCLLTFTGLIAQEVVKGVVFDAKNEPMPGVRVEAVGGTESTVTDIDGNFVIELMRPTKKLRFSYVGFKPQERKITPNMVVKMGGGWAAKPSGYRGFFDMVGGFGSGGAQKFLVNDYYVELGRNMFMFGFNMTHGYQINKNFYVGIGYGAQPVMVYNNEPDYGEYEWYGCNLALYLDFRWDYDIRRTVTPYAGLKMGYQYMGTFDEEYYYGGYERILYPENTGGFLLMPSVGMRIKLHGKRGFNLGVTYNLLVRKRFTFDDYGYSYYPNNKFDVETVYGNREITYDPTTGGVLMLNIGFDF